MWTINISKVQILIDRSGPDTVYLTMDVEPSMYPFTDKPSAKLQVAAGQGLDWVKKNIRNISDEDIEIINMPNFTNNL